MEQVNNSWRKASYSSSNGIANCVEVGAAKRAVLVRDTQQRHVTADERTTMRFTAPAWRSFTASLKR